jgi:hypothetical protein
MQKIPGKNKNGPNCPHENSAKQNKTPLRIAQNTAK